MPLQPDSPLAQVLRDLDIPSIGASLGFWPDAHRTEFRRCRRSPFRTDRHPSFSIYANDRRWMDFGTGEGGDQIDFVAKAFDLSRSEAAKWLIRHSGRHRPPLAPARPHAVSPGDREPPPLPAVEPLDEGARKRILAGRHFPAWAGQGLRLLEERGLIGQYVHRGLACWVLRDGPARIFQMRPLDGGFFPGNPPGKVWNLCGSRCGLAGGQQTLDRRLWMVCEGAPDLLALAALAVESAPERVAEIAFLSVTSASTRIARAKLGSSPPAGGWIFAQRDPSGVGLRAARRWHDSLPGAFPILLPPAGGDWADFLSAHTGPNSDFRNFFRNLLTLDSFPST